jgi:hypothetical protein
MDGQRPRGRSLQEFDDKVVRGPSICWKVSHRIGYRVVCSEEECLVTSNEPGPLDEVQQGLLDPSECVVRMSWSKWSIVLEV